LCLPLFSSLFPACAGRGGALYFDSLEEERLVAGPRVTISNSVFAENSAIGGGAVLVSSVFSLRVSNSSFVNNRAGSFNGGAVHLTTDQSQPPPGEWGPFDFTDVRFVGNVVDNSGGIGQGWNEQTRTTTRARLRICTAAHQHSPGSFSLPLVHHSLVCCL